jgi:hypothetical protein
MLQYFNSLNASYNYNWESKYEIFPQSNDLIPIPKKFYLHSEIEPLSPKNSLDDAEVKNPKSTLSSTHSNLYQQLLAPWDSPLKFP